MTDTNLTALPNFADITEWLDWSLSSSILSPTSQEVFDKYYRSYKKSFSPYLKNHYLNQTLEAMAFVSAGAKILEVGCGCGTESLWFALKDASVLGIDLSTDRLFVAKERLAYLKEHFKSVDAYFLNKNIFHLERPGDGFDLIWIESLLKH